MRLLLILVLLICSTVSYSQVNAFGFRKSEKEIREDRMRQNAPIKIDLKTVTYGAITMGVGIGVMGIGSGIIEGKISNLEITDKEYAKKASDLSKTKRILNFAGGGLGVAGAIICITGIKRDHSGYKVSKNLHIQDQGNAVALVYNF